MDFQKILDFAIKIKEKMTRPHHFLKNLIFLKKFLYKNQTF